jgi:carboxyl-terminal processing protease
MKLSTTRPLAALLSGTAFVSTTTLLMTSVALAAWQNSPKALVDEVWQIVNRDYVDGNFNQVDWQAVRQELLSREYTSPEQAYTAIRQAIRRLNDPYTRFLDPRQYRTLSEQTAGEVSGVGVRLEQDVTTREIRIVETIANSPAARANLKTGDVILEVDGRPVQNMNLESVSAMIRGRVGTVVRIKVNRPDTSALEVSLTRAQIEVPTVRYSLRQEGRLKVGYIRLDEFNSHAAEQMQKAIQSLEAQQVQAFVLDLRGNPGGLLQASVAIAEMWMDNAPVVRTVNRSGSNREYRASRRSLTQLPLAVLVDNQSASASEILSGALQDNRRAVVIGSQTFGKALVQSIHPLSDGSGLAVTIAHYYTPNGTDINKTGITPDIRLDLTQDQMRRLAATPTMLGTTEDPHYLRAVNVLTLALSDSPGLALQPTAPQ